MAGQPRNHDPFLRTRARELRKEQNQPEALLWDCLRTGRLKGFKFRRQHPIGRFITDFYCAQANLVIELDGVTHRGREAADRRRQAWLESQGLLVMRCANHELTDGLDEFLELIWQRCCERRAAADPSPPTPLPGVPGRGEM